MPTSISANEPCAIVDDAVVTLEAAARWDFVGDHALADIPPFHLHNSVIDGNPVDTGVGQFIDNTQSYLDGTLPCLDGTLPCLDGTLPCLDGTLPCLDGTLPHLDSTLAIGNASLGSGFSLSNNNFVPPASTNDTGPAEPRSHSLVPWTTWSAVATSSSSPSSSPTTVAQRKPECLRCKPKKCFGFPLCKKCTLFTPLGVAPVNLAESPFLDRKLWFHICRSLGQELAEVHPDLTRGGYSSHSSIARCCEFVLDLGFEDLAIKRDILETHTVKCFLHLASGLEPSDEARAPCILFRGIDGFDGFDDFVLEAMWRSSCLSKQEDQMLSKGHQEIRLLLSQEEERREMLAEAEKEKEELSEAEQDLFSKIQLILGYYSLLRNIDLIWTAGTTLYALGATRVAIAEVIYLLAFRINMLFVEISSIFPTLDGGYFVEMLPSMPDGESTTQIRSVIFLYAAEILVRGMDSIGCPRWDLQHEPPHSPLHLLKNDLRRGFLSTLNHLVAYECHLSGRYNKVQRTPCMPGLLAFARAAEKGLPTHLIIAVQRHEPGHGLRYPYSFDPFPLLQTGYGRYPIFELFTHTSNELATAYLSGSCIPEQRFAPRLITEHNSRLECGDKISNLKYEIHHESDCTNTSTGYALKTNTKRDPWLGDHPDPPRFCTESILLSLAGVHLDQEQQDGGPGNLPHFLNASTSDADHIKFDKIPKHWEPDFCDVNGQRMPELQSWQFRPMRSPESRRKRKQGDDVVEKDSGSESTHPSKRHEVCLAHHPNMESFFGGSPGHEASLRYIASVNEYVKTLQK